MINLSKPMDRKAQILQLTARLVQTRGFDSFSYNDLSQELGIRKASIHHHFPKKEDLGVALCQCLANWGLAMMAEIEQQSTTAWDKLNGFFDRALEMLESGCICPINSLRGSADVLPDGMTDPLRALNRLEIDFIAKILEEGRETGEMVFKGDPQFHAVMVISTIKEGLQYARLYGQEFFHNTLDHLRTTLQPE